MYRGRTKVTKGNGKRTYTLRLVVNVAPEGKFTEVDKLAEGDELKMTFNSRQAFVSKDAHFYILRFPGFATEDEARLFYKYLGIGFFAFSLRRRIAISSIELQNIDTSEETKLFRESRFPDEPIGFWEVNDPRVDGGIHAHISSIVPEHLRIVQYPPPLYGRRTGTIYSHLEVTEVFAHLQENYDLDLILANEKLIAALNVFSAAYAQHYRPLTYLNLVTVVEILASRETISSFGAAIIKTVSSCLDGIRKLTKLFGKDTKSVEINEIIDYLQNFDRDSISRKLRSYVYNTVHIHHPNVTVNQSAALVRKIYSVRSSFAHGGTVKVKKKDRVPLQTYSETFGPLEEIVPEAIWRELNKYLKPNCHPLRLDYLSVTHSPSGIR